MRSHDGGTLALLAFPARTADGTAQEFGLLVLRLGRRKPLARLSPARIALTLLRRLAFKTLLATVLIGTVGTIAAVAAIKPLAALTAIISVGTIRPVLEIARLAAETIAVSLVAMLAAMAAFVATLLATIIALPLTLEVTRLLWGLLGLGLGFSGLGDDGLLGAEFIAILTKLIAIHGLETARLRGLSPVCIFAVLLGLFAVSHDDAIVVLGVL